MTAPDFKLIRELLARFSDRPWSDWAPEEASMAPQFAAELRKVVELCEVQRVALEICRMAFNNIPPQGQPLDSTIGAAHVAVMKALAASGEPESKPA